MIVKRNIAVCIILTMVTCGFYSLYWFVCLTNDTNTMADEYDTFGGTALLLTIVTCGIYGFFWAYKRGEKIDTAKVKRGLPAGNGGVLYLLLYFFGAIISYALIQNELNQLVDYNERTRY